VDNPYAGQPEPIVAALAGEAEQHVLHMLTGDPLRTPTLVLFADPNYFGITGAADCTRPCVAINPTSAWDHGDVGQDINTTWLGLAGPGVRRGGIDTQTWADHTDVRPTLLALAGLQDGYASDGRVLLEVLEDAVLPPAVRDQRDSLSALARDYKRINAPVGELGMTTLAAATSALESPDAAQLVSTDAALDEIATRRAELAGRLQAAFEGAVFAGQRVDPAQVAALQADVQTLLADAQALGASQ
jgi:hypothetical protein